jgi:hypothetical protein
VDTVWLAVAAQAVIVQVPELLVVEPLLKQH